MAKHTSGIVWKFLERFGVLGAQFVLQIVLARLLSPEHYGILSIMIIFTTLANVFIQTGFNTALIQNKDVTKEDYSSVFWFTLGIAGVFYAIIFFASPLIASFYAMPDIVWPLRVLAIMLFPGALNSVQLAKMSRELNFKKVFISNVGAIVISGIVGIVIALRGGGLWALVVQSILNVAIATVVMLFTVDWHPEAVFDLARIKVLFSFGWKLLVSGVIDTLYQNLQSLVVGKKYDSETLGYFNRGQQFPQAMISVINGTVQTVMLPIMSAQQEDRRQVKDTMRRAITLSSYLVFPLMFGLIAAAGPLVECLLTEKWMPAVPYLQIFCLSFALYPIQSCNLQAINAVGRSDIFLKLEIIKKGYGLAAIVVAVVFFNSPMAIAWTGVITAVLSSFVNAFPNKRLIGYSYFEQIKDLLPSLLMSAVMCLGVYSLVLLQLSPWATLGLQILAGMGIYLILSLVFRAESLRFLLASIRHR